jgi:hypothetical protein
MPDADVAAEEPAPPQVARDAPRGVLEHTGDLLRLEPCQWVEHDLAFGVFMKDAVKEDCVHVRVDALRDPRRGEPQITRRPLHHQHRAALPDDAVILGQPAAVERKHRVRELPHHTPSSALSNPRRLRHANGTVSTHCRSGTFGIT